MSATKMRTMIINHVFRRIQTHSTHIFARFLDTFHKNDKKCRKMNFYICNL